MARYRLGDISWNDTGRNDTSRNDLSWNGHQSEKGLVRLSQVSNILIPNSVGVPPVGLGNGTREVRLSHDS